MKSIIRHEKVCLIEIYETGVNVYIMQSRNIFSEMADIETWATKVLEKIPSFL